MLVIRIELWSAITGQKKELGFMSIANVGGTRQRGNYEVKLARNMGMWRAGKFWRKATVKDFPRLSLGAYDLTLRALAWAIGDRSKKELELVRKSHEAKGDDRLAPTPCHRGGEHRPSRDTGR